MSGLKGQQENAYLLPGWLDNFTASDNDFQLLRFETDTITPFLPRKPSRWAMNTKQPTGTMLSFIYHSALPLVKDISIFVHYELYDGLPLIVKWL